MISAFNKVLIRTPLQSMALAYEEIKTLPAVFCEGLYLSSPDYWNELIKDEHAKSNKEKIARTLRKFWVRSCTRCTPYGTFAGSFLASITDEPTNIILNDSNSYKKYVRIDMNCLTQLISAITKLPAIASQLKLYTNNSLYSVGDNYRYVEYSIYGTVREYRLSSVTKTDYLNLVLKHANEGSTIDALCNILMAVIEVNFGEAHEYISELINAQILISDLEPPVTGIEPFDYLTKKISEMDNVDDIISTISEINALMKETGTGIAFYQALETQLKKLNVGSTLAKNAIQADLAITTISNNINKQLVDTILTQIADLIVLSKNNENINLEQFKKQFFLKFEEAEIPLSVALDVDLGIGYGDANDDASASGDLINDFGYANTELNTTSAFDYVSLYAFTKYNDFVKNNASIIDIKESELKQFKSKIDYQKLPNSMSITGQLIKKNEILDSNNFNFFLSGMGGPSAANMLGRFAHADGELTQFIAEALKKEEEEHPDAIYAEIAHLPQARTGNILLRPLFRKYEIPYVGKSGGKLDSQFLVSDLLVSIRDNKIILRSKSLNKRIIPRLSTAHNFGPGNLPLYRFLCDLQRQDTIHPCIWDWGYLGSLNYLPRVVYKNIILSKARWVISEKDLRHLPKDKTEFPEFFKAFRDTHNLPIKILLIEDDNHLLIDFENQESIKVFLALIKRRKNIIATEFLFNEENCFIKDANNMVFVQEMIIPVYKQEHINNKQPFSPAKDIKAKRKFIPNSEWQYFKVYCGSSSAERILSEIILPFIEAGLENKLFERFFFVRYRDDFGHFRIRFYNEDMDKQQMLQKEFIAILEPLLQTGMVDKIMLDTYNRELERYGDTLIVESEIIFGNDSLAVLRLINMLDETSGDRYRLFLALRGIDALLDDFSLNTFNKQRLLAIMKENYFNEFGGSASLQKCLNDKYRRYQKNIFSFMNPQEDIHNEIIEATDVFKIRSKMNVSAIAAIMDKIKQGISTETLSRLLPSYIHMFMNRLFIAQQRKYELVVYHFLERYYSSKLAIDKSKALDTITSNSL